MKKFVLILALTASVTWGIEVTGVVGLNTQSWNDGNDNVGSGLGVHAGILGSIGITPSCLPAYIGAETGFLIQSAKYSWETGFGSTDLVIEYNNVVIPILLKVTFKPTGGFHIGAGLGPSFIVHTSGASGIESEGVAIMVDLNKDNLATDLGFQLKADVGIKLVPMLWLKPAIVYQLNANPDDPFTEDDDNGSESTLFISIGLAIKP